MEETPKKIEETPQKEQTNIMALISYLGFLCFIPVLTKENDEFVMFHAKQGTILFIGEFATWMIFSLVPVFWLLANILGALWLALSVLGIMNVVKNEKKELPLVGKLAEKINF